ncbi:MAG: ferrous iron transport protein B [Anaerolineales bacterium]|jgi:ferrous iron transport protein B
MSQEQAITHPIKPAERRPNARATIALAGQPNVGKSTIFNLLTGLSQHVGNWPGKTVEYKAGTYHQDGMTMQIIDLPGIYSLTANSLEECIARDFIIKERPDVVVVIVNAAALERNLYLVAELLCLPAPLVLGLNMMDVAEQQGIHIEPHVLEAALGLPVVPLVATRNQGLRDLMGIVEGLVRQPDVYAPARPAIRQDHQAVLGEIHKLIVGQVPEPYPENWVALKLLEGDEEITRMMQAHLTAEAWESIHAILIRHEDALLAVAGGRYEWIGRMMRAAVVRPPTGQITLTDRLDRLATHPLLGLLLLVGVFGLVFWLTYTLALPIQAWLDAVGVHQSVAWIRDAFQFAPAWLVDLLANGLVTGAGTVLTLLPVLVVFFAMLGLLEDTGYMARAAYVMDRFMHPLGLHGKSCLALCLGFGCNVPAVLGARVVESERGRLLTILLTPLVPCAGRLAVLAYLTPIFFGQGAALVSWSLVTFNLLVLAGCGVLVNRFVLHGERMAFIMEMPLYHLPNLRTIGLTVWHSTLAFIRHAGTIILAVSVVVWILASFPGPTMETSLLAGLGRLLEPVGKWMGQDWRMMVALLTSFLAKENTIATLGVLFRTGQEEIGLAQALSGFLAPAAALAFLAVQMLFIPCAATVAVMRQELGSWRWTIFSIALLLVISIGVGIAIYQGGRLLNL